MANEITITERYVRKYDRQSEGRGVIVQSASAPSLAGVWQQPSDPGANILPFAWNSGESRWDFTGKLYVTDNFASAGHVDAFAEGIGTESWWEELQSEVANRVDLTHLRNVSASSPSEDQVLTWNGTAWVPATIEEGGIFAEDDPVFTAWRDDWAQNRIAGRITAGTGVIEQLTGANVRTIADVYSTGDVDTALGNKEGTIAAGTTSQYWRGDKSWQTLGALALLATVDTAQIDDKAVTYAKFQDVVARSVIGRAGDSTGVTAAITAGTDHHVLRRSGTSIGFGTIASAGITDKAVTLAKIEDIATSRVLGRVTAGTGVTEQLTGANIRTIAGADLTDGQVLFGKFVQDSALHWDNTNKRLGIGTASPSVRMHVKGEGPVMALEGTNHAYFGFYPRTFTTGRKAYIGFSSVDSTHLTIFNEDTGDLRLGSSATSDLVIKSGGNVGIGTASPSAELEVDGDIKATGDIIAYAT